MRRHRRPSHPVLPSLWNLLLQSCRRVQRWFGESFPLTAVDLMCVDVQVEQPGHFVGVLDFLVESRVKSSYNDLRASKINPVRPWRPCNSETSSSPSSTASTCLECFSGISIDSSKDALNVINDLATGGEKKVVGGGRRRTQIKFEVLRPRRLDSLSELSPLIPKAVERVSGYLYFLARMFISSRRQVGFAIKSVDSKVPPRSPNKRRCT